MNIQAAILDSHTAFVSRLKKELEAISFGHLQIHRFEKTEDLFESLKVLKPDLIISDRPIDEEEWKKHSSLSLLCPEKEGQSLFSSPTCLFVMWTEEKTEDPGKLYRFQNAQSLYREILSLLSKKKGGKSELQEENSSCRKTVFGSFFGGAGVTTLSQAFAYQWAEEEPDKRILFLDIDPLGTGMGEGPGDELRGWDRLYLSAKSRKSDLTFTMRAEEKKLADHYYFFPYPTRPEAFFELEERDRRELYQYIQRAYQGIVFDDPEKWSLKAKSFNQPFFSTAQKVLIWPLQRGKGRLERAAEMVSNLGIRPVWIMISQEDRSGSDEISFLNQLSMPAWRILWPKIQGEEALIRYYAKKIPWKELLDA